MTLSFPDLWALVQITLRDPREGARTIMALDLPLPMLWPSLGLVVIASVFLSAFSSVLAPPPPEFEGLQIGPFGLAAFLGGMILALIYGVARVGVAFGGTGTMAQSFALMTFVQYMLVLAQAASLGVMLVSPFLSGLLNLAIAVYSFWITLCFIDELHGFKSIGKSLLLFLLVTVGVALLLMTLATLTGQSLVGAV